jgi:hypothetical protein
MKVSCSLAAAALLVLSVIPVRADVIYPTQRCRVYDDTAFIQIPGQCGTVVPFYPRRLLVRSPRHWSYYYYR